MLKIKLKQKIAEKWKAFFTEKLKPGVSNIIATEKYQTIREGKKICKIFHTYFTNVNKRLKIFIREMKKAVG